MSIMITPFYSVILKMLEKIEKLHKSELDKVHHLENIFIFKPAMRLEEENVGSFYKWRIRNDFEISHTLSYSL